MDEEEEKEVDEEEGEEEKKEEEEEKEEEERHRPLISMKGFLLGKRGGGETWMGEGREGGRDREGGRKGGREVAKRNRMRFMKVTLTEGLEIRVK